MILCVIAVGLSAMALRGRGAPPAPDLAATASPAVATADDAATTSVGPPDAEQVTDPPTQPDVGGWVEAWSGDDSDLLVVGDGYSHLPAQWVQLWASGVSSDRPVTIRHWGESEDISFNPPIVLSEGEGASLTVWSASRDRTTIAEAAGHVERFLDAADRPEAVLVSLGQASAEEDVASGLDDLLAAFDDDIPVLISIGPEGLYEPGVGDQLLEWTLEHTDRVSVVDLRDQAPETPSAEQWAVAFEDAIASS